MFQLSRFNLSQTLNRENKDHLKILFIALLFVRDSATCLIALWLFAAFVRLGYATANISLEENEFNHNANLTHHQKIWNEAGR